MQVQLRLQLRWWIWALAGVEEEGEDICGAGWGMLGIGRMDEGVNGYNGYNGCYC